MLADRQRSSTVQTSIRGRAEPVVYVDCTLCIVKPLGINSFTACAVPSRKDLTLILPLKCLHSSLQPLIEPLTSRMARCRFEAGLLADGTVYCGLCTVRVPPQ